MNKNKGFTLIEVLLYTLIFAIVGGLMTGILLTVTQVQQRESASAEVTGQLNFVMQTINRLVRESSNIEIETATTTSILKLRMQDTAKDPTCVSLVSGVIKLAEGPGTNPNNCTTTTSNLTSDRVTVDTFNFKKFVQYPGHDTVSLDIVMTYNSQNPKSRVQRTLSSAIARVSAATFDSNLLPGSTSFTVGQAGSTWQNVFVGDGSASNPSYSFGADTNVGIFRPGADILGFTTNSAERMRIDASGNVGIGTTEPGGTLHVLTSSVDRALHVTQNRATGTNYGEVLYALGASTVNNGLYVSAQGATTNYSVRIAGPGVGANNYAIYADGGAQSYFAGNVGIGTTAPEASLDLGATTGERILIYNNAANHYGLGINTAELNIFAGTSGNINFRTGSSAGTSLMYLATGGNVGIGTTSPSSYLAGTSGLAIYSATSPGLGIGNSTGYWVINKNAGDLRFYDITAAADTRVTFQAGGNVGIGTAWALQARLEVSSDSGIVAFFRNSAGTGLFLTSGNNTWSQNSDERLKDILGNIENANDKLAGLRTVYYKFKADSNNVHRVGLIAQDVQAVIPEAVDVGPDGYLGLHYTDLIPFTIEAIKELNTQIEDLRAENEALKQLVCLEHPEAAVCR